MVHGLWQETRRDRDPLWRFWGQVAMEEMNAALLMEEVRRKDADKGTNNARVVESILRRIKRLEANLGRANDLLDRLQKGGDALLTGVAGFEPKLSWLETMASTERALQELHNELWKYTGDDRLYVASVELKEAQKELVKGATGQIQVLFSGDIAVPPMGRVLTGGDGSKDGDD
jgi:hypothetical protein